LNNQEEQFMLVDYY